jgi:putative transcriptional regulator
MEGMQMDVNHFATRLKDMREAAGITQKQLADRAGLSQRAISHWEQGLREPSWLNVVALAAALGTDCRAFLQEPTGPPAEPQRGRPAKTPPDESAQTDDPPAKPTKKRPRR